MLADYGKWDLSFREILFLLLLLLAGGMLVGWLFFDSAAVGIAAAALCLVFLPRYQAWQIEKRRSRLRVQFRDLLYSVSSSISVGRNLTQALEESLAFWENLYHNDDLIVQEVRGMLRRINESNEKDVDVLKDFAERSGLSEIMDFAGVYENCKTSGANLIQAVNRASSVIGDRISLEQELHLILAQKQFECRIVMASPFLLLLFLKIFSPDYLLPLQETMEGRCISLLALVLIGVASLMMERGMRIEF